MKKKMFALALAAVLSLVVCAAGCDQPDNTDENGDTNVEQNKDDTDVKPEERKLRELPADFKYDIREEEYKVTYGGCEIYGKLWEPDEAGKFPLVIFSHGFNGHYTDFRDECKRLAERGYVAYAFDFCGAQSGGKSTGRTEDEYTPMTMKEDLIAVIEELKTLYEVDSTQIFLWGGSQGGFVTALAAADQRVKDSLSAIALYFPAFNIPDDWHGKEGKQSLMGYWIGADYVLSVQDLDPYAVIGDFKKDVCIVWGDKDELVAKKYIDKAVETYGADRAELTVIEGAGHGFGGTALKTAIDTVLAFLEARTFE